MHSLNIYFVLDLFFTKGGNCFSLMLNKL